MKNKIMNYSTVVLTTIIALSFTSCKKKNDCKAGTGGNVTIVALPQHHGKTIYNQGNYPDTAYVKFDTQDFPGADVSKYDAIFVGDSGEDHVHIENLKCGDYYIYCTGYDTSISQRVTGGIPYSFSQESGEIDLAVPVTE
ncbi:MAG: hypothetical protein ABI723_04480 [Bacteroidia bacterium]